MSRARTLAAGLLALVPASAAAAPTQPGELVNPLFDPQSCELCHLFDNPGAAEDEAPYAPMRTWQGSMMANSARDPVFWAAVAVAADDVPGETELCLRCHAPRAFLEGNTGATSIADLTNDQLQGVECELCHRMVEDVGQPAGNAQYEIDDVLVDTNVPRRGPWDFSDGVPAPPHTWIQDPYTGSSRLCGTCHDVTTPVERVDDDGVGLGVSFNEQRTYSEWLGSAYAIPGADFSSCQDCHMPAVADMTGCTAHLNQYTHETGGRRHDLVGANRFMVGLLKQEYGSMGANLLSDELFDLTIARMDELLATAATLTVQAPAAVDLTQGLPELAVRVTNETGHKLPSGYSEGRIMWLEIVAEYAGATVWSSGLWDPRAGTTQQDAQLRTYEAVGEQLATGTTFHLLLNDHWRYDTRIPPLGLTPNLQTDPVGDRYTLQGDGTWPNFDEHSYAFGPAEDVVDATPDNARDDELLVTIRLRYLVNTPEYIDFLGAQSEAGADVAALFETAGGAPPVVLAEQTVAIPITAFGAGAGTSSSEGSSSAGSSTTGTP
ncbi:MAG: hypothetical protein IAG13_07835, partial [Deltaproteobacteria bacterium]|nr:hypothetical protein [Nannocystaceae bacterium]